MRAIGSTSSIDLFGLLGLFGLLSLLGFLDLFGQLAQLGLWPIRPTFEVHIIVAQRGPVRIYKHTGPLTNTLLKRPPQQL